MFYGHSGGGGTYRGSSLQPVQVSLWATTWAVAVHQPVEAVTDCKVGLLTLGCGGGVCLFELRHYTAAVLGNNPLPPPIFYRWITRRVVWW